jgi:hypothetical protein
LCILNYIVHRWLFTNWWLKRLQMKQENYWIRLKLKSLKIYITLIRKKYSIHIFRSSPFVNIWKIMNLTAHETLPTSSSLTNFQYFRMALSKDFDWILKFWVGRYGSQPQSSVKWKCCSKLVKKKFYNCRKILDFFFFTNSLVLCPVTQSLKKHRMCVRRRNKFLLR